MAKIGIVCKTSFSLGMGHLVRQTHIAKILQDRGAKITFFIPDYPPAQVWLDRCQFPRKTLDNPLARSTMDSYIMTPCIWGTVRGGCPLDSEITARPS